MNVFMLESFSRNTQLLEWIATDKTLYPFNDTHVSLLENKVSEFVACSEGKANGKLWYLR
jgi:hypothetical protein